jgi:exopolyphosphatase/guanosine-5'-triphosphate,3'-diphosphate pyrophosphatase
VARFAAIDIGSNAMRLRMVEVDRPDDGLAATRTVFREIGAVRAAVRLGRDVFLTGALRPTAIAAAVGALREFREAMDEAKIDRYRAVATSAVREAKNGEVLIERAHREAGITIEVIEGIEEARLVQLAVTRRLGLETRRSLLIDIGGGSTELTLLDHGELAASQSLQVGTVRMLEAFLDREKAVDAPHAELVKEFLERVLSEVDPDIVRGEPEVLVATGGNIDTIAAICPKTTAEGPAIDLGKVRKLVAELSAMTVKERMGAYSLREDRADTIIPAAEILLGVARPFDHAIVLAPGTGLKDGILDELAERHFSRWNSSGEEASITNACLRLGRRYHFDEKHGLHVSRLALSLFDDLLSLHGMRSRERLLLHASALLHDIGDFIRYEGHHKHSWYLIEHADIMGLTPAERSVIANVARYHRKSAPDPSHPNFRDLSREDRARVRGLAAILRLADALDREHQGKVEGVRAFVTHDRLRLEVQGAADRALEMWTVERKSELFRSVFDLPVDVVESPRPRRLGRDETAGTE